MNKELLINRNDNLKKLKKLRYIIDSLDAFLKKHEKNFKKNESLEALKKIKIYFEIKQKEYHDSIQKEKELDKKIYSACSHDISIKYLNLQYQCLICGHDTNNSVISIDLSNDREAINIIKETFNEVLYCNKDLIETISEKLEEIQYDKNIKIYRR